MTRYEYTQGDHVHHAVCLSCNKIFPVEVRLEPEYKDRLAEENGFEVTEHRVEIYGFCKECKARGMDKEFKERMIKERQERRSVYDVFFIPCVTEGGI